METASKRRLLNQGKDDRIPGQFGFSALFPRFLLRDLPSRPFNVSAGGGTCLQAIPILTFSTMMQDVFSTGVDWNHRTCTWTRRWLSSQNV